MLERISDPRSIEWTSTRVHATPRAVERSLICSLEMPSLEVLDVRVFAWFSAWLDGSENMKASWFTDAQKAFVVKQGKDGVPVAEICRKTGIS